MDRRMSVALAFREGMSTPGLGQSDVRFGLIDEGSKPLLYMLHLNGVFSYSIS